MVDCYPFHMGEAFSVSDSDSSSPVILTNDGCGYAVVDPPFGESIAVTWPSEKGTSTIGPDSIDDGAWALCATKGGPQVNGAYILYWTWPFQPRVHYWLLDRTGTRIDGCDLTKDELVRFLHARKDRHVQYMVRLIQVMTEAGSPEGDTLISELTEGSLCESVELALFCYKNPALFPQHWRAVSKRVIVGFLASAIAGQPSRPSVAKCRLTPLLDVMDCRDRLEIREVGASVRVLCSRIATSLRMRVPCVRFASGPDYVALSGYGIESFVVRWASSGPARPEFYLVEGSEAAPRVALTIDRVNHVLTMAMRQRLLEQGLNQSASVLFHTGDIPPNDLRPAWSFQRRAGDDHLTLFPDVYYLATEGYRELRHFVRREVRPWREREPKLFWRGSTTGGGLSLTRNTIRQVPRVRLCEIGSNLGSFVDLAVTAVCQAQSGEEEAIRHSLQQLGIWSELVPRTSFAQYRFLVDIDGNANSWSLLEKLLLGACVIKVESNGWEQWYYKDLRPWEHYVPVAQDLTDFEDRVTWCLEHEGECQQIAARGQQLANSLEFNVEMERMADILLQQTQLDAKPVDDVTRIPVGGDVGPASFDGIASLRSFRHDPLVDAILAGPGALTTSIARSTTNPLIPKVELALRRALAGEGKLPAEVLSLEGMSGRKYRLFINNLIESIADARYLEVGVWMGSTLCSAVYGNSVHAVGIDNWSQFGGPASQFLTNLSRFKTADANVSFLESDFRAISFSCLGRFNVYLFDGPHLAKDQRDGVAFALPALEDSFVLIVDDWNWADVREGTMAALRELALSVEYMTEVRTTLDGSHPQAAGQHSDWHNGYLFAILSKGQHTSMGDATYGMVHMQEELVRGAYRALLGREPESEAVVRSLAAAAKGPEALLRTFVESAEFKMRFQTSIA
jgi:Glycosyl transferase family 90